MKGSNVGKGAVIGVAGFFAIVAGIVQPWEGRELRAYHDIVGALTICDGDTNNVTPGMVETPAGCDKRLFDNLAAYEAGLDRCLSVAVPAKVKAAFISWTYNVGVGAACGSTLVRKANAGDVVGACNELPRWNRAGGRVVRGLANRRAAEQAQCLEGLRGG